MLEQLSADLPTPEPDAGEHSERLRALIEEELLGAGGSIDFARFMEMALYAPGLGYYVSGSQKFGSAGDFVTAPEISPLFSRCLARQVAQILRAIDSHQVLEIGAGSGIMAADMLLQLEQAGCLPTSYAILELSPDLRERQRQTLAGAVPHLLPRVRWLDGLPEPGYCGVVLANEVLDAMPVRRFRITDGRARPLHVTTTDKRFQWTLGPPDVALELALGRVQEQLGVQFGDGYESERCLAAAAWVASLAEILARGVMILIDYGYTQREFYHPQRASGTLLCHYRHRVHADPLVLPGLQDITASVDFSAVAASGLAHGLQVLGFTTQTWFLFGCGLEMLVAGSDPADIAAHLELTRQVKTLTLPGEMGERFKVLALGKDVDCALLGFGLLDQREKL